MDRRITLEYAPNIWDSGNGCCFNKDTGLLRTSRNLTNPRLRTTNFINLDFGSGDAFFCTTTSTQRIHLQPLIPLRLAACSRSVSLSGAFSVNNTVVGVENQRAQRKCLKQLESVRFLTEMSHVCSRTVTLGSILLAKYYCCMRSMSVGTNCKSCT